LAPSTVVDSSLDFKQSSSSQRRPSHRSGAHTHVAASKKPFAQQQETDPLAGRRPCAHASRVRGGHVTSHHNTTQHAHSVIQIARRTREARSHGVTHTHTHTSHAHTVDVTWMWCKYYVLCSSSVMPCGWGDWCPRMWLCTHHSVTLSRWIPWVRRRPCR